MGMGLTQRKMNLPVTDDENQDTKELLFLTEDIWFQSARKRLLRVTVDPNM